MVGSEAPLALTASRSGSYTARLARARGGLANPGDPAANPDMLLRLSLDRSKADLDSILFACKELGYESRFLDERCRLLQLSAEGAPGHARALCSRSTVADWPSYRARRRPLPNRHLPCTLLRPR